MSIITRYLRPSIPSTHEERVPHPGGRGGVRVLSLWRVCRRFPWLPFTVFLAVAALLFAGLDHSHPGGDGAPHLSSGTPAGAETNVH